MTIKMIKLILTNNFKAKTNNLKINCKIYIWNYKNLMIGMKLYNNKIYNLKIKYKNMNIKIRKSIFLLKIEI